MLPLAGENVAWDWLSTSDWEWFGTAGLRLIFASVMGALVGLEREHRGRSAGLRTHLLVSLGACLVMLVSLNFAKVYADQSNPNLRVDPARVAYGVMTGIGFLGAGAIIRLGPTVRGLTTAASLWCTAAVGLAAGFGMYWIALVAIGLILIALVLLHWLDDRVGSISVRTMHIVLPAQEVNRVDEIRKLLRDNNIRLSDFGYHYDADAGRESLDLHVSMRGGVKPEQLIEVARGIDGLIECTID